MASPTTRAGNYDAAVADYSKAIRLNPKYGAALNNRAVAYRTKGDLPRALADLALAIRLNPKSAQAFTNRGLIHLKLGNRDRAIVDFRRAVALKPSHRIALAGAQETRGGALRSAVADNFTKICFNFSKTQMISNI